MKSIKLGCIGAGGIMNVHLGALKTARKEGRVEVVGVADTNEDAAVEFVEKWDIEEHGRDFSGLLGSVDAVLIGIPTHLHSEIAIECLNAGKAVFCEKPIARTMQQADAMIAASQNSDAPLQIGFVRRYDAEWLAWREAIQNEKIGRPVVWRDVQSHDGPPSPWYFRDEQGGGPFLDGCIHNHDFALHTFGRAKWAFCHGRSFGAGHSAIDTGTATVHFESGDEMLLAWSWGLPDGCAGATVFELLGPQGIIQWPRPQGDSQNPVFAINTGAQIEPVPFPSGALGSAFEEQMEHFLRVVKGEESPRATGEDGRNALQIALAILESARSDQVVAIN